MRLPTEQEAREQVQLSIRLAQTIVAASVVAEQAHGRAIDGDDDELISRLETILQQLANKAENHYERAVFYSGFYHEKS